MRKNFKMRLFKDAQIHEMDFVFKNSKMRENFEMQFVFKNAKIHEMHFTFKFAHEMHSSMHTICIPTGVGGFVQHSIRHN